MGCHFQISLQRLATNATFFSWTACLGKIIGQAAEHPVEMSTQQGAGLLTIMSMSLEEGLLSIPKQPILLSI